MHTDGQPFLDDYSRITETFCRTAALMRKLSVSVPLLEVKALGIVYPNLLDSLKDSLSYKALNQNLVIKSIYEFLLLVNSKFCMQK